MNDDKQVNLPDVQNKDVEVVHVQNNSEVLQGKNEEFKSLKLVVFVLTALMVISYIVPFVSTRALFFFKAESTVLGSLISSYTHSDNIVFILQSMMFLILPLILIISLYLVAFKKSDESVYLLYLSKSYNVALVIIGILLVTLGSQLLTSKSSLQVGSYLFLLTIIAWFITERVVLFRYAAEAVLANGKYKITEKLKVIKSRLIKAIKILFIVVSIGIAIKFYLYMNNSTESNHITYQVQSTLKQDRADAGITVPGTYYVSSSSVNVYLSPRESASITNRLSRNQKLEVYEIKGRWARITNYYDGSREGKSGQVARWVLKDKLSSN